MTYRTLAALFKMDHTPMLRELARAPSPPTQHAEVALQQGAQGLRGLGSSESLVCPSHSVQGPTFQVGYFLKTLMLMIKPKDDQEAGAKKNIFMQSQQAKLGSHEFPSKKASALCSQVALPAFPASPSSSLLSTDQQSQQRI